MLEYLVFIVEEFKLTAFTLSVTPEKFSTIKKLILNNEKSWDFIEYKERIISEFELDQKWYDHFFVIIKSSDYTSLEIELPFNTKNLVEQTIELQIAEKIPFDISDFCISYKNIFSLENTHTFHIGLMPKKIVAEILKLTSNSKSQPDLISTIPSFLRNNNVENGIVFYKDEDINYGLVIKDSIPVEDFIFKKPPQESHELKLRAEKYNLQTSEIEFKGDITDLISELISINPSSNNYLVNFRTMNFAYNKTLSTSLMIAKDLSFPIIFCIFGLLIYIFLNYFSFTRTISSYRSSISSVLNQFPELKNQNIQSTEEIGNLNYTLSNELSSLNSQSKGALEYLASVTDSIEKAGGMKEYNINSLTITAQKIIIEGNSKSYANVEKLERAFHRLKNIDYCNITKNTSGTEQTRNFTFTLDLVCQS